MSMKTALAQINEKLGATLNTYREVALALATAEGTGTGVGEAREKFNKVKADVESLKTSAQQIEGALRTEIELSQVVNAPAVAPETLRAPGSPIEQAIAVVTDSRKAQVVGMVREAFMAYIRFGDKSPELLAANEKLRGIAPTEQFALFGKQLDLGGALVPEDFRAEVVKNLGGRTVMRAAGAKVVPTSGRQLIYPSITAGTDPYSTGYAGSWRAEGAQGTDGTAPSTQNQPTFGQEVIPVNIWQPDAVIVTQELLADSAVPLDQILAQCISEALAQDEDYAFLRGDGIGRPRGVLNYVAASTGPAITAVNSGSASAVTYNGLVDLYTALPIQYRDRAVFFMRSATWGEVLKLKDSSQMPLLYAGQPPDTIFGKKIWLTEHMPAIAGSAYPILYGDPSYYVIAQRMDLSLQRLVERFAPNVGYLPTARVGGGLVRTAPWRAQKIST